MILVAEKNYVNRATLSPIVLSYIIVNSSGFLLRIEFLSIENKRRICH